MLLLNKKFNRDKLKQTLIDKGINLNSISKAIWRRLTIKSGRGISASRIIYILEAKNPKPSTIKPICDWLGIDTEAFYK